MTNITSQLVTSSDGAIIYAEATGNAKKPPVIFVTGYTQSGIVFDKQFEDAEMCSELYLVSPV
jgi:hypothetical protein